MIIVGCDYHSGFLQIAFYGLASNDERHRESEEVPHTSSALALQKPQKCRAIRVSETSLLLPVSAHRSTQASTLAR